MLIGLSRRGFTGADPNPLGCTDCSLPSNKLELWFAMESERFQGPVFRELYSEKEVVTEERLVRAHRHAHRVRGPYSASSTARRRSSPRRGWYGHVATPIGWRPRPAHASSAAAAAYLGAAWRVPVP